MEQTQHFLHRLYFGGSEISICANLGWSTKILHCSTKLQIIQSEDSAKKKKSRNIFRKIGVYKFLEQHIPYPATCMMFSFFLEIPGPVILTSVFLG